jgi:hypothetical protein
VEWVRVASSEPDLWVVDDHGDSASESLDRLGSLEGSAFLERPEVLAAPLAGALALLKPPGRAITVEVGAIGGFPNLVDLAFTRGRFDLGHEGSKGTWLGEGRTGVSGELCHVFTTPEHSLSSRFFRCG